MKKSGIKATSMETIQGDFVRPVSAIFVLMTLATYSTMLYAGKPVDVAALVDSVGQQAVEAQEVVGVEYRLGSR